LPVDEFLQNLGAHDGLIGSVRDLHLLKRKIEVGDCDFLAVQNCDGLALGFSLATRCEDAHGYCRNNLILHLPALLKK
jgi:hypothetical protein